MKKPISMVLVLAMLFLLAACSAGSTVGAEPQPEEPAPQQVEAAPTYPVEGEWANTVTVHTVDELLAALAPDTRIYLAAGDYNLADASDYGAQTDGVYSWVEVWYNADAGEAPAYELTISEVDNLALIAESVGDSSPSISAVPRYANVLRFVGCNDIALWGITAGHTEEPGECSGGVVMLENVAGAQINECYLYGCGTVGIQAVESRRISAEGTHIFDCSISAVNSYSSLDIFLDHCKIYNCGINSYDGLFSLSSTTGFALLNSDITDCTGMNLFTSGYSRNVSMLGCTVGGSTAFDQALFSVNGGSITVDNCAFDDGLYYPAMYSDYSDGAALTLASEELTASVLAHMECVETQHPGLSSVASETALDVTVEEGISYVHVETVDELLAAIAPDTVIYLDAPRYDLSTASTYGGFGGEWYGWLSEYDGAGLNIMDVDNLSIISENGAEIVTVPRYVDVLRFTSCRDVTLSGVTLGHTEQPGECVGNVVGLYGCTGVNISECCLYGCGVVGVYAVDCESLNIASSEIYDCSNSAVNLYSVNNAVFTDCNIHDCGAPEIYLSDCGAWYNGEQLGSGSYYVTESGVEAESYPENASDYASSGGLRMYYEGNVIQSFTMHVGEEVTLSARYDDGTVPEKPVWYWGYDADGNMLGDDASMPYDNVGATITIKANEPGRSGGMLFQVIDGEYGYEKGLYAVKVYVIE